MTKRTITAPYGIQYKSTERGNPLNDSLYLYDSAADSRHVAHMNKKFEERKAAGLVDEWNFPTIKWIMKRIRF